MLLTLTVRSIKYGSEATMLHKVNNMIMWLKAVVIAVSAIIGVGSVVVMKMKHDNPIEEVAEAIIKNETGLNVDLTPSSPEIEMVKEKSSPDNGKAVVSEEDNSKDLSDL